MTDSRPLGQWHAQLRAPCEWLLSNLTPRGGALAKMRMARRWRVAAFAAATVAQLPRRLAQAELVGTIHLGRNAIPVTHVELLAPTLAAVLAGLGAEQRRVFRGVEVTSVGYGMLAGPAEEHLVAGWTLGEPNLRAAFGAISLRITTAVPGGT